MQYLGHRVRWCKIHPATSAPRPSAPSGRRVGGVPPKSPYPGRDGRALMPHRCPVSARDRDSVDRGGAMSGPSLTRRAFLKGSGALAASVLTASAAVACGSLPIGGGGGAT